jgi:hypothetical protein
MKSSEQIVWLTLGPEDGASIFLSVNDVEFLGLCDRTSMDEERPWPILLLLLHRNGAGGETTCEVGTV